ncbi:hypothetical protein Tco_0065673 [Tanacetum coccineum]
MNVHYDISRRRIEKSLVGFRKNNMVCGKNRVECEKVIELFLRNLTSLNSYGIFGTHSEQEDEYSLTLKMVAQQFEENNIGIRHVTTLTLRGKAFDKTRAKVIQDLAISQSPQELFDPFEA